MNHPTYPIVTKSVPGRFFVDESCIYCDFCVETAPANFAYDSDQGVAYVMAQPANQQELNQTLEALEGCPIESIGDRENYRPNYVTQSCTCEWHSRGGKSVWMRLLEKIFPGNRQR